MAKITLCGSARFESKFHEWNERLTLKGHVVYSLAVFPSSKSGEHRWYTEEQKKILDLVHLAKIEESDAIFLIEPSYTGESTGREIEWAKIREKKIMTPHAYTQGPPQTIEDYKLIFGRL